MTLCTHNNYSQTLLVCTGWEVLIALFLPHTIPLKVPWIVSTSDSEYVPILHSLEGTYYQVPLYIYVVELASQML